MKRLLALAEWLEDICVVLIARLDRRPPIPWEQFRDADSGGYLKPGLTQARNLTDKPEQVRPQY